MKAYTTTVKLGNLELEGLMDTEGNYYVAATQANRLLQFASERNETRKINSIFHASLSTPKTAETHSQQGFSMRHLTTKLSPNPVKAMPLPMFEVLLAKLDRAGNQRAQEIRDAIAGLAMHQLFSDAFGVEVTKSERQQWLEARLKGKQVRLKFTDALKMTGAQDVDYATATLDVYRLTGLTTKYMEWKSAGSKGLFRDTLEEDQVDEVKHVEQVLIRLTSKCQSYQQAMDIFKSTML